MSAASVTRKVKAALAEAGVTHRSVHTNAVSSELEGHEYVWLTQVNVNASEAVAVSAAVRTLPGYLDDSAGKYADGPYGFVSVTFKI